MKRSISLKQALLEAGQNSNRKPMPKRKRQFGEHPRTVQVQPATGPITPFTFDTVMTVESDNMQIKTPFTAFNTFVEQNRDEQMLMDPSILREGSYADKKMLIADLFKSRCTFIFYNAILESFMELNKKYQYRVGHPDNYALKSTCANGVREIECLSPNIFNLDCYKEEIGAFCSHDRQVITSAVFAISARLFNLIFLGLGDVTKGNSDHSFGNRSIDKWDIMGDVDIDERENHPLNNISNDTLNKVVMSDMCDIMLSKISKAFVAVKAEADNIYLPLI